MEFVFSAFIFLSESLSSDSFQSCLPAVAVSVMQVLSGTSSLCFLYFGNSKSKFANRFSTKQPEPQPESQVHVGGGWQMAAFPQRHGGEAVDVAGLSPPSHRRECSKSGESGVERQGQGDSCRTPRPYHLDGK